MDRLADTILDLASPAAADSMVAERLVIDLPVELHVREIDGALTIEASAPTQRIATSLLPVFHGLRIEIAAERSSRKITSDRADREEHHD